jgi:hypothetical protein
MLRRVALVGSDVSEECIDSNVRVKIISELRVTLSVNSNWCTLFTREVSSYKSHRRRISEDGILEMVCFRFV